jgi:hypothetical protein
VFASIGTCFVVKADTGLNVNVGIGKAWFHHTWTLNDAILPMTALFSEVLLDRIDALVIEVNSSDTVRENSIKFIKGIPASSPVNPLLAFETDLHQYPLCYIYRAAGSTEITQADITNTVGTASTPFVTGILQTISLNELLGQWEAELDQFVYKEQNDFRVWFEQMKVDLLNEQALLDAWIISEQEDFLSWFEQVKEKLSEVDVGELLLDMQTLHGFINIVSSRVTVLELITSGEVSANPFYVTFTTLSGTTVTGTWNNSQARVEF